MKYITKYDWTERGEVLVCSNVSLAGHLAGGNATIHTARGWYPKYNLNQWRPEHNDNDKY